MEVDVAAAGVPKKRTFKKFSFRGVDLDALLDMSTDELVKLFTARARRRYSICPTSTNSSKNVNRYASVVLNEFVHC